MNTKRNVMQMIGLDRVGMLLTMSMLAAVLIAQGCASYVNIPAEQSDTAIHSVNLAPVPEIMNRSLAFAAANYPARTSTPAVIVPAGASQPTMNGAVAAVGEGASAWGGPDDARDFYRVLTVQIRGGTASVEILLPDSEQILDRRNLLEVSLKGSVQGWRVDAARRFFATPSKLAGAADPAMPPGVEPGGDDVAEELDG